MTPLRTHLKIKYQKIKVRDCTDIAFEPRYINIDRHVTKAYKVLH